MATFKNIKLLIAGFAIVGVTSIFALKATAADPVATSAAVSSTISIVDTQKILEESSGSKKIREQIDKKAEEFKNDSTKKEEYFKKKYEDLEKQKSALAKDAFEKKSAELSKEFGDAQQKVQESRGKLDKGYMEAMQKFDAAFLEAVKEAAAKNGSKIVLQKVQTIYSDDALDITADVLAAVNKKMPTVEVKFQ